MTDTNKDWEAPADGDNPYLDIERRIYQGRGGSLARRIMAKNIGLAFLGAFCVGLLGLVIADTVMGFAAIAQNRTFAQTVRVGLPEDGFAEENYAELVRSEGDSIDFDAPYGVSRLLLDAGKLSVSGKSGDQYALYRPGSGTFWDSALAFAAGEAMDVTALPEGDYLICWGNQASVRLRPLKATDSPSDDDAGDGLSLLQDPSLLDLAILRVGH